MGRVKAEEFWNNVAVGAKTDCWPWLAGQNGQGRGRLLFNGRMQYAYRVAVELTTGSPIPSDKLACHSCDNPICVNPAHIFIGTHADNSADAARKGRMWHTPITGVDHHNAKVSAKDVAQAIARHAAGETQTSIAESLGVTQAAVSCWVRGLTRADGRGAA